MIGSSAYKKEREDQSLISFSNDKYIIVIYHGSSHVYIGRGLSNFAYIFCFGHYLAGPKVYVYKWHTPDHNMLHSPYGRESVVLFQSFDEARQSVEIELVKDGYVFLNDKQKSLL